MKYDLIVIGNGTGVGIAGDESADGSDVFAKPHKNF